MIGNDVVDRHRRQEVIKDTGDAARRGELLVPLQARDLVRNVRHEVQPLVPVPVADSGSMSRVPVFVRVGEVLLERGIFPRYRVQPVLPVVGCIARPGGRIAELHEAGNSERLGVDEPRGE